MYVWCTGSALRLNILHRLLFYRRRLLLLVSHWNSCVYVCALFVKMSLWENVRSSNSSGRCLLFDFFIHFWQKFKSLMLRCIQYGIIWTSNVSIFFRINSPNNILHYWVYCSTKLWCTASIFWHNTVDKNIRYGKIQQLY